MSEQIKDPQIYVSEDCKSLFKNMAKRPEFKFLENKDLFMLAVLFGYLKGGVGKKTLARNERTKSGLTRERYLSEKDNSILKAICLAETKDIEMVTRSRIQKVYSLAEQYANGGHRDLKRIIFEDAGSFVKLFAALLIDKKRDDTK
jgi:hypothetical protein